MKTFNVPDNEKLTIIQPDTNVHWIVGEGACVKYYRVGQHGPVQITLHEKATLDLYSLDVDSSDFDLTVALTGEGSQANIKGTVVGNFDNSVNLGLCIEHQADNCISTQLFKCVAADKSKVSVNSKVVVDPNNTESFIEQNTHNLLLSSGAEIDVRPELEIYNDQVKCSHGATIGSIDEQHLFYLNSRGISLQQARTMILQGFVMEPFVGVEEIFERNLVNRLRMIR